MSEATISSILAVDFGSTHTRALLFDLVDGEYRLVARGQTRTTMGYPIDDVHVGVERILQDITEATGRRFFNDQGELITPEQLDRSGVDYYVTTASAGRPLKVMMVGLVPGISIATAMRATSGAYVEPVGEIHLEDGANEEDRLNQLVLKRPDLIFVSGGTDGGAQSALVDILTQLRFAISVIPEALRPSVLYAGNAKLADKAKELLGSLTRVMVAPNVRPTESEEELEPAQIMLGQAYDEHKEQHGFSYRHVAHMTNSGILPTSQSYATMTEYFAQTLGVNALSLDVGSATTTLSMSIKQVINTAIRTDIGMGHSARSLVEMVGEDAIADWLPFYLEPDELINYVLNKGLRPATVPMDLREMYIEYALLRAGVRHMMAQVRVDWESLPEYGDMPPIGLVMGAGATLTNTGYPGLDMLLMVDAIQPTGITHFKSDPYGAIPALGAMALTTPHAVVQLIEDDIIEHLGTVISVTGRPKVGSRAIRLSITTEDGEEFEHEINGGDIWLLPLPRNVKLTVEIRLSRGLSINGKGKLTIPLQGGKAGVLFDARGRDLMMGVSPEERAANMPRWMATAMELETPMEIPELWLEKPEPIVPVEEPQPEQRRRGRGRSDQAELASRMKEMTGEMPAVQGDDLEEVGWDDHDEFDDLDEIFGEADDGEEDPFASLRNE